VCMYACMRCVTMLRYIAVTQPMRYAKHKNSKRVYVMLALTWIISITISSPIVLGMNYTDRRLQSPTFCTFYNSDFLIFSSMGSFYIPGVVMVFLYWRVFDAIKRRARKSTLRHQQTWRSTASRAADKPSPPHPVGVYVVDNQVTSSNSINVEQRAVHLGNGDDITSNSLTASSGCRRNKQTTDETAVSSTIEELVSYQPVATGAVNAEVVNSSTLKFKSIGSIGEENRYVAMTTVYSKAVEKSAQRNSVTIDLTKTMSTLRRSLTTKHTSLTSSSDGRHCGRNTNKRERKATKTLAIVLGKPMVVIFAFETNKTERLAQHNLEWSSVAYQPTKGKSQFHLRRSILGP